MPYSTDKFHQVCVFTLGPLFPFLTCPGCSICSAAAKSGPGHRLSESTPPVCTQHCFSSNSLTCWRSKYKSVCLLIGRRRLWRRRYDSYQCIFLCCFTPIHPLSWRERSVNVPSDSTEGDRSEDSPNGSFILLHKYIGTQTSAAICRHTTARVLTIFSSEKNVSFFHKEWKKTLFSAR